MTAKSHREVISKPYKNTRLQQTSQRSHKTYTDSLNYDSCQSFNANSDWSANNRKINNVVGTLVAKYDFSGAKDTDLQFKAGDEI